MSTILLLRQSPCPRTVTAIKSLAFPPRCLSTSSLSNKISSLLNSNNQYSSIKDSEYVIVGGGSAGCVLANRLSEEIGDRVTLLEAGPSDTGSWDDFTIHMPAALTWNLHKNRTAYNWHYETLPQVHMHQRRLYWPRGKVLGGSSSLNAMVYIRGHAFDYDRWQNDDKCKNWSYAHCLPYFKKSETCLAETADKTYRGSDGPLKLSRRLTKNPLFDTFINAGVEAGYKYTNDMNGYQQEGFGPIDLTIHQGRRWSSSVAYLWPALHRQNLKVLTNSIASRIIFENGRAVGVEFIDSRKRGHGSSHIIRATKEVILCGGSINTPQLLMISGIGNVNELRNLGINAWHNLPGVGQNLQDHLEIYVQHSCSKPITLHDVHTNILKMGIVGLEWLLKQSGLGTSSHLEAGAFIRSREGIKHPDIQLHFLPSTVHEHGTVAGQQHAFQVHIGTMRAESRGYIALKSQNPFDAPIIQPSYLASENDRHDMRECVKLAREIFGTNSFNEFRGVELSPGPRVLSDADIDAFVKSKADSAYHPCGTCKMGDTNSDNLAVVNHEGRVNGIDGLRVVDASIIPSIISGNLNAPVIMMAEKISDSIRGRPALIQEGAPVWTNSDWMTKQR